MKCRKCGKKLRDGVKFCESCGTRVIYDDDTETEEEPKKHNAAVVVLLSILIALMLLVAAAVGTYLFVDNQSNTIKESYEKRDSAASQTIPPVTPSPAPTAAPKATEPPPVQTLAPISSRTHLANPSYSVYNDSEWGFSCAYPSHFEKYIDNTTEGRYTLRNSDGTATLRICAEDNSANITLAQSLSMFTAKNAGQIELSRTGGTYYIIKVNDNGICRYRYLVSKNNKLYWFDLTYPKEYEGIYDSYTQHLYESFTVK